MDSKSDFFALYDALISGVGSCAVIDKAAMDSSWAYVGAGERRGIAMATPGDTVSPLFSAGLAGLPLCEAARAASSWNLTEASFGLAAVNAYYNTPARIDALLAAEPFENYCTAGLDLRGKTVGMIGHLKGPDLYSMGAAELYIIERAPKPGDYPDAACDYLLPRCDVVLITGSSLVNKTLPHLLSLCRHAYTILVGPSVPLCPSLFDFGIDRLAGMALTGSAALLAEIERGQSGTPYPFGRSFMLSR